MNALDLDQLRGRWADQDRQLDAALALDIAAVRASLAGRSRSALQRHRAWVAIGGVCAAAVSLLLLAFLRAHAGQWSWMLLAAGLLPLALSELAVDLAEWRALRRLDLSAPVLALGQRLDALEERRLRQVRAVLASSVLLWLPLLMVLAKGLLGVDLLRALHPSVLWVNFGLGLLCVPLCLGLSEWIGRRLAGRAELRRWRADAAGDSWARARGLLDERAEFEAQLAADPAAALAARTLPAALAPALQALRRRLLVAILLLASLLLAIGLFNAVHGGQARFIVPGVLLNLAVVLQMAAGIELRNALGKQAGGVAALRVRLASSLRLRRRFAVAGVVALPLLAPMLLQLLAAVLAGSDLLALLGAPLAAGLLLASLAASAWLARNAWRRGEAFAPALVDALAAGALVRGRDLLARLAREQAD